MVANLFIGATRLSYILILANKKQQRGYNKMLRRNFKNTTRTTHIQNLFHYFILCHFPNSAFVLKPLGFIYWARKTKDH